MDILYIYDIIGLSGEEKMGRLKNNRGVSLIEAMVAVVVLGIMAAIMLGIFQVSFNSISDSTNTYLATLIAQQEMEIAIKQGYGSITAQGPIPVTVSSGSQSATFWWQLSWSSVNSTVKAVTITVKWNQKGAVKTYPRSLALSTWIAE